MNLKTISQSLILFMLCIIISCSNNNANRNAEAKSTGRDSLQHVSADTAAIHSNFPAGATQLHQLPEEVRNFIKNFYPGYNMIIAVSDPLCQGGDAVDVTIKKKGSPNLSLIFKPDGSFVQQEEDVPLTTAPGKVREALKARYADYSAGNQIERLILADKTVQYMVDLNHLGITKEVIFDTEGNVVCEN